MHTTNLPLYKQLISDLKSQIDANRYAIGDLSSFGKRTLQNIQYHPTNRQASFRPPNCFRVYYPPTRKGSIVAEPKKALGILSLSGVTAGIGNQHLKTVILEKPVKSEWPADFFHSLTDSEQKAGCIFFSRIRYINDSPVLFEETFITNVRLPRFTSRNLENKSLFKTLQDHYQVEIKEGEQKIWAIATDEAKVACLISL